ncbi:GPW/gp25 family protein [Streptomyces sp. M19]
MIEQLLFTSPGERVMRPDFGCGLLDLVFTPNSPELASALELSVHAALQRWLGELIEVESVDVASEDHVVRVRLRYAVRGTAERRTTSSREGRGMSAGGGRRAEVRRARLNGVDAVEAEDDGVTLTVTFIGKAPHGLGPEHVRIDGGRRITGVRALETAVEREEDPELDDRLYVTLDRTGDTSAYRLAIVDTDPYGRPGTEPFPASTSGTSRRTSASGPAVRRRSTGRRRTRPAARTPPAPVVDYTARDYATLRRLALDRLALTTPTGSSGTRPTSA